MAEFHKLLARLKNALESPAPAAAHPTTDNRVAVGPTANHAELVSGFARELEAVSGRFLGALAPAEAAERVASVAREAGAQRVAVGEGAACDLRPFAKALERAGCAVVRFGPVKDDGGRARMMAELAGCDLSVAAADFAIASSGTFAVMAAPGRPNSLTLLAPASVIVVHRDRLVPDLAAALAAIGPTALRAHRLSLITGPSRTADIEKLIVLGVHGPKALYGAIIWPRDE
jgi:L-lactate dehydrogenase complex protein LldG